MRIIIKDDLEPQDCAMSQALYSRSPASIVDHLKKIQEVGSGKFMAQYYVGYGHASIGDCGSTTIFVEDVSMLAAKAIQNWPLYKGQEASTRYMDFSKVRIENPLGTVEGEIIQKEWMAFYHKATPELLEHLKKKYPIQEGEAPSQYERAIKARCFDILRAFIPAGATTQLSWHTDLRQAQDHLNWLCMHPDRTIKKLSQKIEAALRDKYPSSFTTKHYLDSEAYRMEISKLFEYYDPFLPKSENRGCYNCKYSLLNNVTIKKNIDERLLKSYSYALKNRPPKTELPTYLSELGTIKSQFFLDFGSFRDLQRHRAGIVRMPLLTSKYGFHQWYLNQLSDSLFAAADELLGTQLTRLEKLKSDKYSLQYYIPMGFMVPCRVTQPLNSFIYRLELRTSKTVHPTLRKITQEEVKEFQKLSFASEIALHVDMSQDDWDIRRGNQTILVK